MLKIIKSNSKARLKYSRSLAGWSAPTLAFSWEELWGCLWAPVFMGNQQQSKDISDATIHISSNDYLQLTLVGWLVGGSVGASVGLFVL